MDYFALLAEEMRRRLELVRSLLTAGQLQADEIAAVCEREVREALRDLLPQRFGVAPAILDFGDVPGLGPQSNPLDIVVYDALHHAPIWPRGPYIVLRPEAVLAVIEVKANLTSGPTGHLAKALEQVRVLERLPDREPCPRGHLFGFDGPTLPTVQRFLDQSPPAYLGSVCVLERDWCLAVTNSHPTAYESRAFYYFYYNLLTELHRGVGLYFPTPPDVHRGGNI